MKNLRALFATALVLLIVGCGSKSPGDGQGPTQQRLVSKIKFGEQVLDGGGVDGSTGTGTVTFTATEIATATATTIGTQTVTTSATSTHTQVATTTETATATETTTSTNTATQTAATTATGTTTASNTWTDTVTTSRTQSATASVTSTATQSGTITQTVTQTQTGTVIITVTTTNTATATVTSTQTRTVTSSNTTTTTGTLSTVLSTTQTYVLTGTLTSANTATVSNVSWPKNLGKTVTNTTTEYLLGTASKVVTATVTSTSSGSETKTVTARIVGTGTATGSAILTATATRTVGSTYYGAGSKTLTSTKTATGTATQSWTYHPTGTITRNADRRRDPNADAHRYGHQHAHVDAHADGHHHQYRHSDAHAHGDQHGDQHGNRDQHPHRDHHLDRHQDQHADQYGHPHQHRHQHHHHDGDQHQHGDQHRHSDARRDGDRHQHVDPNDDWDRDRDQHGDQHRDQDRNHHVLRAWFCCPGAIDGQVTLGQTHQLADLQGVWCITGDLRVENSSFTDLAGLETLVAVGGNVQVTWNPALTTVNGLNNLKSAHGLGIDSNPSLTSLAGLANLHTLGFDPYINNNSLLPACWTWQLSQQTSRSCSNCMGNVGSGNCGSLPDGFVCQPGATGPGVFEGNLTLYSPGQMSTVGGVTCITGDLRVENSSFTDLAGLETLVAVGGNVQITWNPALTTVNGLNNLKSAHGLGIDSNPNLTSLAGLANLHTLGFDPYINNNSLLPACWTWQLSQQTSRSCSNCMGNVGSGNCGSLPDGFVCQPGATGPGVFEGNLTLNSPGQMSTVGGVTCITGNLRVENSSFTDLAGLETLVAVGGNVQVTWNPALTTVNGLNNLKSAHGLGIDSNPSLTSLAGLANLRTLGFDPYINNNSLLPACWTWQLSQQTSRSCSNCMGNVGSGNCGSLPDGFVCQPGATGPGVFEGNLTLYSPGQMSTVGGVTCITGDLRVENSSLTDLAGLETLVAVGGNVQITWNPALTTVNGLNNLKSAHGLGIDSNPNLTSLAGLANLHTLGFDPYINNNSLLPACWTWQLSQQTSRSCSNCMGNVGSGNCGSLPDGFVCQPGATGPGVFEGNLTLYSPGQMSTVGGVTCITGDLRVENSSFTDLAGLETLVAVGGNVQVTWNPALTTVNGLNNLKSAHGLGIDSNPNLTSLAGLANLHTLGFDPYINNNSLLPACWAQQIAQQTSRTCSNCMGNDGTSTCQGGGGAPGTIFGPCYAGLCRR
jgi:hypothetical protein